MVEVAVIGRPALAPPAAGVSILEASVVVPTRDRPRELERCLAALARQDVEGLEVIVVDDGAHPSGAAVAVIERACPGARLVRSPGRGPAAARNLGARVAAGEIVCFTDDDCEPSRDWARGLVEAARAGAVAAGRTVAPAGAGATVVASQAIVDHLQLSTLDRRGLLGFAPACNLAARREVLARLPFDESYPGAAAEDRDWCERAVVAGLAPVYVPGATVVHRQAAGARSFIGRQYRYGRGAARFRRASSDRRLAPPSFYAGLVRRGFAAGIGAGMLIVSSLAATAAGVGAERLGARRDP
jgi:GT2 family glycosyltransferase